MRIKIEKPDKFIIRLWLSCQGSNLDSSDPESDVLPITPQDNVAAKIIKVGKTKHD